MIKKLALRIFLLDKSIKSYQKDEAQDVFVRINYKKSDSEYGNNIKNMYKSWAKHRGMRIETLKESFDSDDCNTIYSFIGFGAFSLLRDESGYHVFEHKSSRKNEILKTRIKVDVIAMTNEDHRLKDSTVILERFSKSRVSKNVRRYKMDKSPIVKDLKNHWQTGKIDRVLNGDFDFYNSSQL